MYVARHAFFTPITQQLIGTLDLLGQKDIQQGKAQALANEQARPEVLPSQTPASAAASEKTSAEQTRAKVLNQYGLIRAAAEFELCKEALSVENRLELLNVITKANNKINEVSAIFFATHPIKNEAKDKENISKIHLEEKVMLEENIFVISKEIKKNKKRIAGENERLSIIHSRLGQWEDLNRQIIAYDAPKTLLGREEKQALLDKRNALGEKPAIEKAIVSSEGELKRLKNFQSVLSHRLDPVVELLKEVLGKIDGEKEDYEKMFVSNRALKFAADALSGSVRRGLVEDAMGITKESKKTDPHGELFKADVGVVVIGTAIDMLVTKGRKRKIEVLKKSSSAVLLSVLTYAIAAKASVILGALGTVLAGATKFFLAVGAVAGIANPIGAIVFGVVVAGVALYGLGLLIYKNRARIVKVFSKLAENVGKRLQALKARFCPSNAQPLSLAKKLPTTEAEFAKELSNIAHEARNIAKKIRLEGSLHELRKCLASMAHQPADDPLLREIAESLKNKESEYAALLEQMEARTKQLEREVAGSSNYSGLPPEILEHKKVVIKKIEHLKAKIAAIDGRIHKKQVKLNKAKRKNSPGALQKHNLEIVEIAKLFTEIDRLKSKIASLEKVKDKLGKVKVTFHPRKKERVSSPAVDGLIPSADAEEAVEKADKVKVTFHPRKKKPMPSPVVDNPLPFTNEGF